MTGAACIRVDRVTAGYGTVDVLRDVCLAVPRGSVVALLGPNGAGKTTLLRACSATLPVRRGEIRVDGVSVSSTRPHELAALGVCHIPEGRAVFPALSVAENISLMANGRRPEALERAVDAFPVLGQKLRQAAGTMSGGEQQMLALARAYVTDPTYVLLDEVSMGLAPMVVDLIYDFLARLRREGRALLIVEQYVHRALALADLVFVLTRGRIAFAGEPHEVDVQLIANQYLGSDSGPQKKAERA